MYESDDQKVWCIENSTKKWEKKKDKNTKFQCQHTMLQEREEKLKTEIDKLS